MNLNGAERGGRKKENYMKCFRLCECRKLILDICALQGMIDRLVKFI